jgi:hypothetical protein
MTVSAPISVKPTAETEQVTVKTESEPANSVTMKKKSKKRNYSEWYTHVKKFKTDNPGMTHSEAVHKAKATYIKTPKVKRDTSKYKPNPWMVHIKECIKNNPEWRNSYSYKELLKKCKETYKKSN